jgi:hypothetical protein
MSERERILRYLAHDRDMLQEESHILIDQGRNDLARMYDRIAMHMTAVIENLNRGDDDKCMSI